jgi:hypothetical protein
LGRIHIGDEGYNFSLLETLGCKVAKIETMEEKSLFDTRYSSGPMDFRLKFDETLGEYVWNDGTELQDFLKVKGVTDKRLKYPPVYYNGVFVERESVQNHNGETIYTWFEVQEIYKNVQSAQQALRDRYKSNSVTNIENNAFINPVSTTTDTTNWFKVRSEQIGVENEYFMGNNYWGTTNEETVELQIYDGKDNIDYARLNAKPYLTKAPETTYPFVTNVTVLDKSGEEVTSVGTGEIKVRVEFNRDMDTSIPLNVAFGNLDRETTIKNVYKVKGEYVDERTWEGTYYITTLIESGYHYFIIDNGCAKGTNLKFYEDVARFAFKVDTTSAQAMIMQAEPTDTGINLTWFQDDFETLVGYNVYRSTSEDGFYKKLNTTIIPVDEKTFFDDTVEPGQVYYYNFTVVKSDLSESTPSGKIVIRAKDTMKPNIYHSPVGTAFIGENLVVNATITDNLEVKSAKVYYRTVGETEWKVSVMNKLNDKYTSIIQSSEITLAGIEYYIEASDGVSVTTRGSATSPYNVLVKEKTSNNDLGDVNGDGVITNIDALMILQAINDQLNLTDEQFRRADLNGDGALTSAEALKVLHYVSGKNTDLTA